MNKRRLLQTLLAALALLMPGRICAVTLVDADFVMHRYMGFPYYTAGLSYYEMIDRQMEAVKYLGHITITDNHYKITIPAHSWKYEEGDGRSYWFEREITVPAITIEGKCKQEIDHNISNEEWVDFSQDGDVTYTPSTIVIREEKDKEDPNGNKTHESHVYEYTLMSHNLSGHRWITGSWYIHGEPMHSIRFDVCYIKKVVDGVSEPIDDYVMSVFETFEGYIDKPIHISASENLDYEEDNEAEEKAGTKSEYLIPSVIGVALTVGSAALMSRMRRRRGDDEEGDDEEEEEDEDTDDLRMDLYKDFGDTLLAGDAAQKVCACIIRMPKNGPEYVDERLTRMIQISSDDNYLTVEDNGIENDWHTAYVYAPECEVDPPKEGVVKFRLATSEASYENRIHFKILKPGVIYEQDNLTFPDGLKCQFGLPFTVTGMSGPNSNLHAEILDKNHQETKDFSMELSWDRKEQKYYAWISDLKEETDRRDMAGKSDIYWLNIETETESGLHIEGGIPLYRFYLGLAVAMKESIIGSYIEPTSSNKEYRCQTFDIEGVRCNFAETELVLTYFNWEKDEDCIKRVKIPVYGDKFRNREYDPKIIVKAKNPSDQELVNSLGVVIETVKYRPEDKRTECVLICKDRILAYPKRIPVSVEIHLRLKDPKGKELAGLCTFDALISSQPLRKFNSVEEQTAALKEDHRIGERLMYFKERIQKDDLTYYFPDLHQLMDYVQLIFNSYDRRFGYDKNIINSIIQNYYEQLNKVHEDINTNGSVVMSMEEIDLWWRFSWWNPILKNFEYVKTIKAYIGGNSFIGGLIWGYATSGISTAVFTIINIIDDIQKEGSGEYLGLPKDIVLNEVLPESMYRVGVVAYHLGKVFIVGKGKEWFVGKYGDRISNGVDKI